jgi:hypothetical protein
MYAKTDLYPGQELFFDYGYNSKSTKFVPLEHKERNAPPKDTKVRVKLAGRTTKVKSKSKGQGGQRIRKAGDDEESEGGDQWTYDNWSEAFASSE